MALIGASVRTSPVVSHEHQLDGERRVVAAEQVGDVLGLPPRQRAAAGGEPQAALTAELAAPSGQIEQVAEDLGVALARVACRPRP